MAARLRSALTFSCFAGLLVAGNAFAGSFASSQLTDIQITLSDLGNPAAGPLAVSYPIISYASVYSDPLGGYPFRPSPDPATYQYVSNGSGIGSIPDSTVATSTGGILGRSVATSNSLTAAANASSGMVSSVTGAHAIVHEPIDSLLGLYAFVLAPNTALTLSAWASVEAQSDGQSVGPTYWETSHSAAYASLSFDSPDGLYPHLADTLAIEAFANEPQTLSDMRFLTLTYSNDTDQEIHLLFDMQAAANATAVPEPSNMALTILALAAAAVFRFSKRRSEDRG